MKPGVNSGCREVHPDTDPGEGAFSFYAGRQSRIGWNIDVFGGPAENEFFGGQLKSPSLDGGSSAQLLQGSVIVIVAMSDVDHPWKVRMRFFEARNAWIKCQVDTCGAVSKLIRWRSDLN